jgi:hypothetical protein
VGEHKINVGQSSPIRLVFCVELDPGPVVVGSSGPRPNGASARGYSGPGCITLRHEQVVSEPKVGKTRENISGYGGCHLSEDKAIATLPKLPTTEEGGGE